MADKPKSEVLLNTPPEETPEALAKKTTKTEREKAEEARRKKEQDQWKRILAEFYSHAPANTDPTRRGHLGFDPTDEEPKANKESLSLQDMNTTTDLLKDGTWISRMEPTNGGPRRTITVKNGSVTSSPTPETPEEYQEACWEMFMFMKQKGQTVVNVDFPKDEDITKERLELIIAAAEEAGVHVDFGPKIRAFLDSNKTNHPRNILGTNIAWKTAPWKIEKGEGPIEMEKLSNKQRDDRKAEIMGKLNAHNNAVGLQSKSLEERQKIQNFHYKRYLDTLTPNPDSLNEATRSPNVSTPEAAKREVDNEIRDTALPADQIDALEKQTDILEKQLATIENARAHLKLDLEYFKTQLAGANNAATKDALTENIGQTEKLLEAVEARFKNVTLRKDQYADRIAQLSAVLGEDEKLEEVKGRHQEMQTTINQLKKDIPAARTMFDAVYADIPRPGQQTTSTLTI